MEIRDMDMIELGEYCLEKLEKIEEKLEKEVNRTSPRQNEHKKKLGEFCNMSSSGRDPISNEISKQNKHNGDTEKNG